MSLQRQALQRLRQAMDNAAALAERPAPALLAVSKTQAAEAVASLAAAGQRAFGENYVQEALAKMQALRALGLEWHLIGKLQSNKCQEVATHFDWVQSVDRAKLADLLDRHRPASLPPLQVLVQVNPDNEAGKSGCSPADLPALARHVASLPGLRLRGLMAIPAPDPDFGRRRETFRQLRHWFDQLCRDHPGVDTLSMGMSEDFELAIAEGATMIRIGSALFGPRSPPPAAAILR